MDLFNIQKKILKQVFKMQAIQFLMEDKFQKLVETIKINTQLCKIDENFIEYLRFLINPKIVLLN